jgi:hypothetical protein
MRNEVTREGRGADDASSIAFECSTAFHSVVYMCSPTMSQHSIYISCDAYVTSRFMTWPNGEHAGVRCRGTVPEDDRIASCQAVG